MLGDTSFSENVIFPAPYSNLYKSCHLPLKNPSAVGGPHTGCNKYYVSAITEVLSPLRVVSALPVVPIPITPLPGMTLPAVPLPVATLLVVLQAVVPLPVVPLTDVTLPVLPLFVATLLTLQRHNTENLKQIFPEKETVRP
jgi:hypothetical protein